MILFPLNGESIRKCLWGNNLLVRSDQICGDTETRCLPAGRSTNMASPNFCYTCWRTTQQRKTAQTRDSARLFIYRYSIISEILGFRHIPQIYLCHHFLCLYSWIGLMISSLNVSGLADRKFLYQYRACSPWDMMLCATSIGHDPYI